jgi:hypothetical protein
VGTPPTHRPDRRTWRPAVGYLAIAFGLVGGAIAAWWPVAAPTPPASSSANAATAVGGSPDTSATARVAPVTAGTPRAPVSVAAASALPRIPRLRDPNGDQTPDLADYVNDGEKPTMNEVLQRLHAAGVHTGLGAFNPPGTKPVRIGLAVPEDFPLPPGYVRHYQATDDGQRVEPVLMFAPDYQPLGADGQPVPVPADRVVPPELAPPGFPMRRITVPAPTTGP